MIDCLHRKRHGPIAARRAHAGVGDASAHLYQAVEAAATCPGSCPPIRVERHVDQCRVQFSTALRAEAKAIECVGSVAVDEYIGATQQVFELSYTIGGLEVEARAALAEHDVGNGRRFVPARRINAEHIGTVAREETRCDGAGEDACQIEHANPRKRACSSRARH